MTTIAEATGAPVQKTIGDKIVDVYPLRFEEWGKVEQWMRQEIIASASRAIRSTDNLSERDARIIIGEASRASTRMSIMHVDAKEGMLQSMSCMLQVVHLSLSRGNKHLLVKGRIPIELIGDLLGNDQNVLEDIVTTILDLSFPKEEDSDNTEAKTHANPTG